MSKLFFDFVDNLVDKEGSEYYMINKRKRHFWHSKSITFAFRVREENDFNRSNEIVLNIRAFLLGDCEPFFDEVAKMAWNIREADEKKFRNHVYHSHPNTSREELDKNMGLIIMSLGDEEKKGILGLNIIKGCRLLGYEKELFYLKCYCQHLLPVFIGRVLYHVKFNHFDHIETLPEDFTEGIDIGTYLDGIRFL